ncbi:MAG: methyltransferase domain-containing protein [Chloroflexi bacterium]|nr:methyltransferase domain-containing protein [Chloroflexota bacterium]
MRLIVLLLRPIYYLLYHQFAWTYDFVAAVVSLGRWQDWVRTALPFLSGRVLEIGFGCGHLQLYLNEKKLPAFGLDESRQMAHQASRRLRKQGYLNRLSCGYAQSIPFAEGVFDSVVATFPAEFIFDPQTLEEIRRVLMPAGKLVILPMAWITGRRPLERLVAWLLRVSGEVPGKPGPVSAVTRDRFARLGFEVRSEIVEVKGSQVLVFVAEKKKAPDLE